MYDKSRTAIGISSEELSNSSNDKLSKSNDRSDKVQIFFWIKRG